MRWKLWSLLLFALATCDALPAYADCDPAKGWPIGKTCQPAANVGVRSAGVDKALQTIIDENAIAATDYESVAEFCAGGGKALARADATLELWRVTCGNYNWHAVDDATQAGSVYTLTCTGEGTGTVNGAAYTGPGVGSCFRSGEPRTLGLLHALGVAIDHTADNGVVVMPPGVFVDTGCGTLSNGTTRATCPYPYFAEERRRSDWAQTGPHAWRYKIQVERGITVLADGWSYRENDAGDATVTQHRPKLGGTWILNDRGNNPQGAGAGGPTLDGPSLNFTPQQYQILFGGLDAGGPPPRCRTTSVTSALCQPDPTDNDFLGTNAAAPYGKGSFIVSTSEANGQITIDNTIGGTSDATYSGVCSLNPRIGCGSAGATNDGRVGHGCTFDTNASGTYGDTVSGVTDFDAGVCVGVATQWQNDQAAGKHYEAHVVASQCEDNPTTSAHCDGNKGSATYTFEARSFTPSGSNMVIDVGVRATNQRAWPFPWGDYITGGFSATVQIRDPVKARNVGRISGIGFMPANWVGRDGPSNVDCLSNGDEDNADDEPACDSTPLVGFAEGEGGILDNFAIANGSQAHSLQSSLDMIGASRDNTIRGGHLFFRRRGALSDLCSVRFRENAIYSDRVVGVASNTFPMFCQDIYVERSKFDSITAQGQIFNLAQNSRNVNLTDSVFTNIAGSGGTPFTIAIANGLRIERVSVVGSEGPFAAFTAGSITALGCQIKGVSLRENRITGGRLGGSYGTGRPTAAVYVEAGAATGCADELLGFVVDGLDVVSDEPDVVGVWFEDDCTGSGGACTGADASALVSESRARAVVANVRVTSDGSPRAVGIGANRLSGGHFDATDSRDPVKEAYAPLGWGNFANGVPEETQGGPMGQLAAQTPDCNTGGTCPRGFLVKITDATAANACTDTTPNDGQLDTGSAGNLAWCKWDGTAWVQP